MKEVSKKYGAAKTRGHCVPKRGHHCRFQVLMSVQNPMSTKV